MAINPSATHPSYCKNCSHRFVCDIQEAIRNMDKAIEDFNTDNSGNGQKLISQNYSCAYKQIDQTV